MARREPLNEQQRRLLKIAARMPLASVANLAPVLDLDEERVRRMLGALRRGGWVTSVVRGMTERRQHRWFLTRRAVDLLYVTDHQHPSPREGECCDSLDSLVNGG
jgi:DNA-binding MarR family transcriptional regulator